MSTTSDQWQGPSQCADGNCPEVMHQGDVVCIRASNRPGVVVELTAGEWAALVKAIRAGEIE